MNGEQRREKIINHLKQAIQPVSGKELAENLQVSRQVIVQDIALLRANGIVVGSTPRGYILEKESQETVLSRVFTVCHVADDLERELCIIVDNGGIVKDVAICHPVYGEMRGELALKTRRDIRLFIEKVEKEATLLSHLTKGIHEHTVTAPHLEDLDRIEQELKAEGFLVK